MGGAFQGIPPGPTCAGEPVDLFGQRGRDVERLRMRERCTLGVGDEVLEVLRPLISDIAVHGGCVGVGRGGAGVEVQWGEGGRCGGRRRATAWPWDSCASYVLFSVSSRFLVRSQPFIDPSVGTGKRR